MITSALLTCLLLAEPTVEVAAEPVVELAPPTIGGVIAPAVMPRGSTSLYVMLGAPDVGGGFRQGFSLLEFEARLLFNYLEASAVVDAGVRYLAAKKDRLELGVMGGIGFGFNSGSRYYDRANFAYIALRPRLGAVGSFAFTETVTGLVTVELPWAIALTNRQAGGQFTPTVGLGAEVHLGGIISGLLLGQVGVDAIKEPLGVTQVRIAWAVRLGLGFRLF